MSRPHVIPCSVFEGRSPKTGLRVWTRHRWNGGAWGLGRCEFCGRTLEEVRRRTDAPPANPAKGEARWVTSTPC